MSIWPGRLSWQTFGGAAHADSPCILPLCSQHARECARLHAMAFAHGWSAEEFESLLSARTTLADAACIAGRKHLLGMVLTRKASDEAEILTLVTDSHMRGRGIARQMLAAHLGHVAAAGVRQMFLEVEDSNLAALALYRRFGFVEVGHRKAYYRKPDGTAGSALVMRLDFANI